MKKLLTFTLAGLLSSVASFGQMIATLDTNGIAATFSSDGMLFTNGIASKFTVPKNSGRNTFFTGNLWIGGKKGGQLHNSGQTYGSGSLPRYFSGPIATNYTTSYQNNHYGKIWKINKATINYHIANYNSSGYVVPASIANWPANGDVANGEAATLAPYTDANNDGIYNPINGDYPQIRGDQAVFFVFNDDRIAQFSYFNKLGVEVRGMAYSFASTDSALNQTVFVNYQIFNRSANRYDSLYVGSWMDFDLGNYADDYVGTDTLNNMYYAYNGDNDDANMISSGYITYGYGTKPPAQGVMFLNRTMNSFLYYNNDSNFKNGNPTTANNYYNYLKGIWRDKSPVTYGSNGINPNNAPTKFMFSGDAVAGTGWTEFSAGNPPGDRRGLGVVGPISLASGGQLCLDLAFPFARDYNGNNLTSVALLRQRAQSIRAFYNSQNYGCQFLPTSLKKQAESLVAIYPNPSKGQFQIRFQPTAADKNYELTVYNVLGESVYQSVLVRNEVSTVDISSQASGMYFVKISDGKTVYSAKIVVE